jgi:hypothetical protein
LGCAGAIIQVMQSLRLDMKSGVNSAIGGHFLQNKIQTILLANNDSDHGGTCGVRPSLDLATRGIKYPGVHKRSK